MANAFSKEERVFFADVIAGFDPNNITARQVMKFKPSSTEFERSALKIFRPAPYITLGTDGLTLVDAAFVDRTQLSVPSELNANDSAPSDIKNIPWKMNAIELNDPLQRDMLTKAAIRQLSATVDSITGIEVAKRGSIFIKDAAALTTYSQLVQTEEQLSLRDSDINAPRTMILNPTDYNGVAGNLAERDAPPTGISLTAFQRSQIGPVGGFDTFKANFMPTQNLTTATGYLVNGANQDHDPVATDSNGNNVDNRTQTLIIDTGSNAINEGDAFTIADVNAVSQIHKNDIGQLQIFRVTSTASAAGGQTITITPAIVVNGGGGGAQANKDYANCSAIPANNAVITFLNLTANKLSNIFFRNDAVEIVHGSLATMDLDAGGVATMRGATDSGIEIMLAKQSAINDLSTKYRWTMWVRANVLVPELCGNLIGT